MTSQEATEEDTGALQWSTSFHLQISFSDKGGFPLSRNFYDRKHVNFTRVNKIKAAASKRKNCTLVNFYVTHNLPYIASISFMRVNFTRVRT